MKIKTVVMKDGEISLHDDNILHAIAAPGMVETLTEAQHHLSVMRDLADGQRLPALVDLRALKGTSREAREFYGSREYAQVLSAAAILVDSPVSRVIGNFYMGLNKGMYPVKLFSSEEPARDWLLRFLP